MAEVYRAGVCNIGPAEVAKRRAIGWGGLALGVAAFLVLAASGAGRAWRLIVFLPLVVSASGFVQASAHT